MKEFTGETLFEWRDRGVLYIGIHRHIPELTVSDEITEYIVTPFLVLQDAQAFLLQKTAISDEEQTAAFFFIDSSEAFEIATGITGSRFYMLSNHQNLDVVTNSLKTQNP